jgi:hypothetical protein
MRRFLLAFLASFFLKVDLVQSETLIVQLPRGANEARVDIPSDQNITKVIFHKISTGNELIGFRSGVFSNVKAVAVISGKKIAPSRSPSARELLSKRGWLRNINVRLSDGSERSKINIGAGQNNSGGGTKDSVDPFCACLTEAEISYYIRVISALYGVQLSRAQVCEYLMEGRTGPLVCNDSSQGGGMSGVHFKGILEKDTCARDDMLVKIEVSLKEVTAKERAKGISVAAYFAENPYTGGKMSSIKPKGEGKWPEPLALMQAISGGQIKFYKWNGSKKERIQSLPTDYAFWRGILLFRSPIGKLMRGGRGVFAAVSADTGYSICANLTATRQYFNGYPR